ncbi:hypothetical protein HYV84_03425 [Candidatus Woesearchaeota archaeon]|nr:hypothetical protein [Candidatus Woesearchaeota archaeon]
MTGRFIFEGFVSLKTVDLSKVVSILRQSAGLRESRVDGGVVRGNLKTSIAPFKHTLVIYLDLMFGSVFTLKMPDVVRFECSKAAFLTEWCLRSQKAAQLLHLLKKLMIPLGVQFFIGTFDLKVLEKKRDGSLDIWGIDLIVARNQSYLEFLQKYILQYTKIIVPTDEIHRVIVGNSLVENIGGVIVVDFIKKGPRGIINPIEEWYGIKQFGK